MAVFLDEQQSRLVSSLRKPPANRPRYYNAGAKQKLQISEDFEAFLILQGKRGSKETLDWLKESNNLALADGDRDALLAALADNEQADAAATIREIGPIVRRFERFRGTFVVKGFEAVGEVGQLLGDLQRPMLALQTISRRSVHRQVAGKLAKEFLLSNGITIDQQRQLQSWYTVLTAY